MSAPPNAEGRGFHLYRGIVDLRPEEGLTPDRVIAWFAERQHRTVAVWQLLAAGLSRRAIEIRVLRGLLYRVHVGVYAVGCRSLTREGRWMAAVLAAGVEASLSHWSGAILQCMFRTASAPIEVTAPTRREIPGLRTHRAVLLRDEVMVVEGIPVTTPARTIVDLASMATERQLSHAVNQMEVLRVYDQGEMDMLLERHRGRRGIAKLRSLMPDSADLRSPLEERFRVMVEDAGLPAPEYNAPITLSNDYVIVDALWREQRLVVELDSRTYHQTTQAFERDRERDRRLTLAGFQPVRLTPRQLQAGVEDLRRLLRTLPGSSKVESSTL